MIAVKKVERAPIVEKLEAMPGNEISYLAKGVKNLTNLADMTRLFDAFIEDNNRVFATSTESAKSKILLLAAGTNDSDIVNRWVEFLASADPSKYTNRKKPAEILEKLQSVDPSREVARIAIDVLTTKQDVVRFFDAYVDRLKTERSFRSTVLKTPLRLARVRLVEYLTDASEEKRSMWNEVITAIHYTEPESISSLQRKEPAPV